MKYMVEAGMNGQTAAPYEIMATASAREESMKLRTKVRILALLLILLTSGVSYSQERSAVDDASALIEEFMRNTNAPGVAVTVGVKGQIVWSEGFGYADVEQRVPVWPGITRFRVGSTAKSMTAVAVGQLYEQGRLDLDAPVQDYVPAFPEKEGMITTRLLAGHLGGIRDYQSDEFLSQKRYATVLDGLGDLSRRPVGGPSGEPVLLFDLRMEPDQRGR